MLRETCRLIIIAFVIALASGPMPSAGAADMDPAASTDPEGGIVGDGTPGSCDETALHNALAGGGAVTFNCGGPKVIVMVNSQTISQNTTLDGGGKITITGGLATRLFDVSASASLTLRSIVLDSGYSNGTDGGAITNAGTLNLEHVTIQYSQTDLNHSGGAIFTSGPLSIVDSDLHDNLGGNGGAIFAYTGGAVVHIQGSTVHDNQALYTVLGSGKGGALWIGPGATVNLIDDFFSFNSGEGNGGAVYNEGQLTSQHVAYSANHTTRDLTAALRGYGGAIASYGPLTMTHSFVYNNKARFGGGLFVSDQGADTHAEFSHGTIWLNRAVYVGGGVHIAGDHDHMTIESSLVQENVADIGGGVGRTSGALSIIRSTIGNNTATNGGGVSNSYTGPGFGLPLAIYDTTIFGNVITGTQGGGILNQSLMQLVGVTLEGNATGIYNIGSSELMSIANTVLHSAGVNCAGDGTLPTSLGGNFSSDMSCSLTFTDDAQGPGLDPLLGPLVDDGAYTSKYFIPLPNSPLVNTAYPVFCSALDQRGATRPDACDKGAVEYRGILARLYLPLVRRAP